MARSMPIDVVNLSLLFLDVLHVLGTFFKQKGRVFKSSLLF